MQVQEIQETTAAMEEMRTKLYISHKRLALNRTPENFENFKAIVNDYKKLIARIEGNCGSSPYTRAS
jgi:uncharacterized protein YaaR (DUF327 family)